MNARDRQICKKLLSEVNIAHPEVPWRAISGMRDVTAHRYQTLRKEDVYKTCVEDLPSLRNQILAILSESDS